MISRIVEVREGEWLGPIDWGYDFAQHFASMGHLEGRKAEACRSCMELLRQVEEAPDNFKAVFSHGDTERSIYRVGMYDGWPYWRPTPALLVGGTLGVEVYFFYDLRKLVAR